MRHRKDLDGIRAFAVLAVFLNHTPFPKLSGGWTGVDVFFVLSGYLITRLLIREHETTGRIRYAAFYGRRALRLYPALILLVVLALPFYRLMTDSFTDWVQGALTAVFYVRDFTSGFNVWPHALFGHTWSLAIEEQFYLVWPPLLGYLIVKRRDPFKWAASASIIGLTLMVITCRHSGPEGYASGYFLPWIHGAQLFIGCAVALFVARGGRVRFLQSTAAGAGIAAVIVAHWVACGHFYRATNLWWEMPSIGVLSALLLLHLENPASALRKAFAVHPLVWLGRRSYGFYLFHVPVLGIFNAHLHYGRTTGAVVGFVVTLAVTALSYQFVELPFLRMKKRLQPVAT